MNPAGLALALAMLFGAPVGAGVTGNGLGWGLAFAAIYLGYMLFFRTKALPSAAEIFSGEGLGKLIPSVVVQATLGLALTLLGLQLRSWFQITAEVPIWPWIALCCGGVLVGRVALGPWANVDLDEANRVLDDMQDKLEQMEATVSEIERPQALAAPSAAVATCLTQLGALPASEVAANSISKAIAAVGPDDLPELVTHLAQRAQDGRATDLRAYVLAALTACDPRVADAFEAIFAAGNAQALAEALTPAEAWVTEAELNPDGPNAALWANLPTPARLADIADQIELKLPGLANRLVALANRMENLELDDDR